MLNMCPQEWQYNTRNFYVQSNSYKARTKKILLSFKCQLGSGYINLTFWAASALVREFLIRSNTVPT